MSGRRSALNTAIREILSGGVWVPFDEIMKRTRDVVLVGEALRIRELHNSRDRNGRPPRVFARPIPLWRRVDVGHRLYLRATLLNMASDHAVEQSPSGDQWRLTSKARNLDTARESAA